MKLSPRIRFLNFFRNFFRIRPVEDALVLLTTGRSPDSFFCKLAPNPYQYPKNTFRILKRNGIRIKLNINDYLGHFIYFGFYDASYHRMFQLCKPGNIVVDVGMNIGWTTLNFAKLSGSGTIFGFEPDPKNYNDCKYNLALNNFTNIIDFPLGLSDVNSQLTMEVREATNRAGNRISPSSQGHKIDVVRLDEVGAIERVTHIDLIKIDVEGYELNVLKGATGVLQRHHPVLFIELDDNNLKDQGHSAKELIEFLNNNGYKNIISAEDDHLVSPADNFGDCHFDIIAR